eukprot:CAMPEP_0117866162 /NCGR_PEP_ID=MMETSP0950-20121206/7185_1 /TAXON_ID=44440 /ORGANISM="Chattonella subsalsa, Strain CCMP2191" /LENGTH=45 /DNA_ID= /DNA_START= /DNA_END= /DNA_ORIENTATION=
MAEQGSVFLHEMRHRRVLFELALALFHPDTALREVVQQCVSQPPC